MDINAATAAAGFIASAGFLSVSLLAARQLSKRRHAVKTPPMYTTGVPLLGGFFAFGVFAPSARRARALRTREKLTPCFSERSAGHGGKGSPAARQHVHAAASHGEGHVSNRARAARRLFRRL